MESAWSRLLKALADRNMRRGDLCEAIRQRLKRLPAPYDAHYGVVPPAPPAGVSVMEVAKRHEAAVAALAQVDALAAELSDPYLVSRILTRREAVSSSSIEGTNSTLDEILSVEATGEEDASGEARQVRDYALTLDAVVPEARAAGREIFTIDLVKQLHRGVIAGDQSYQDLPGELRSRVVWIGGGDIAYSTYTPAPPDDVEGTLSETLAYMRCQNMEDLHQTLVARMAVVHVHFEAVHPFRDGNGRVGRLLLPLMMAAEDHIPLYLSPYIEAHKPAYYEALKTAQQRLEWHAAIGFLSDAIVGTVAELKTTRTALAELTQIWRVRRSFRKGSAARRALDLLPHHPVITAPRLAELLGVSLQAASLAVSQLAEARVLEERTGYRRNRVFAASEALLIINRPFGAEPILPTRFGDERG
jgi:cell filamentation protein, protein adenylyltransferase